MICRAQAVPEALNMHELVTKVLKSSGYEERRARSMSVDDFLACVCVRMTPPRVWR
jgi:hypothetical protein